MGGWSTHRGEGWDDDDDDDDYDDGEWWYGDMIILVCSLDGRSSLHDSIHLSGYCIPYLIRQSGQFSFNVYKGILDGVGWLLNNLDEYFFIGGRRRQTVNGVDSPIKKFRYLELDMNLSCGCLFCCYLFCLLNLSPIYRQLSKFFHFNSGEVDSWSWIKFTPGLGVLILNFTFFCLSIIIVFIFVSWRGRTVWFCTVSYTATRK